MSESYVSATSNEPTADQSGKVDTAKQEASDLKDTATGGAKQVAGTAKDEVKNLAGEAKYQVKDLYSQGKRQLSDQAGTQQKRVAGGLRSVGDDLDSLASGNGGGDGIAADVVRNVSQRIGSAASFLENRDPSDLLDEVTTFARRRPAVFIGGSLVAGVVIGRLVRALAQNASDERSADTTPSYDAVGTGPSYSADYSTPATGVGYAGGLPADVVDTGSSGVYGSGSTGVDTGGLGAAGDVGYAATGGGAGVDAEGLTAEDTPLYTQTASFEGDAPLEGGDDVRTDRY